MIWIAILVPIFIICVFAVSDRSARANRLQRVNDHRQSVGLPPISRLGERTEQEPLCQVSVKTSGDECFFCTVAGVKYRCNNRDVGGFLGYVKPQPDNEHDKNACAVYRVDNAHLGYIPAADLAQYREWSNLKTLPCVGFIKEGDAGLFGKVKIIGESDEDQQLYIVARFVRWMVKEFGTKFVPQGFEVSAQSPRTKKEWLDLLDSEIAKLGECAESEQTTIG